MSARLPDRPEDAGRDAGEPLTNSVDPSAAEPAPPGPHRTFGAFRHRYYRWIWIGALVSTAGTWLQASAVGYIVAEETGDAFLVSLVGFLNFIPTLFLGLIGGVIADRFDRRRVLIVTQWTELGLVAVLAILFAVGWGTLGAIYAITFLLGITLAVNGPTYVAFYPTLVPPEDLPSAISMNSMQWNLARVVGPAIGGFVLQVAGAAITLGLNSLSFLGTLIPLYRMRPGTRAGNADQSDATLDATAAQTPAQTEGTGIAAIRDGFRYVRRHGWVGVVLGAKVIQAAFAAQIITLLPAYATRDLGLDAAGNGLLFAAFGLGGACGALASPHVLTHLDRTRFVPIALAGIGITLAGAAFANSLPSALAALFVVGFFYIGGGQVGFSSVIQMGIHDHMRGRVSSMIFTIFVGVFPLAALGWGVLADAKSVAFTYVVGGALCVVAALVIASRPAWLRDR